LENLLKKEKQSQYRLMKVSRETNSKKALIGWSPPFFQKKGGVSYNDTAKSMIKASGTGAFGDNPDNAAYRTLQL
jgi:hypothetical protein